MEYTLYTVAVGLLRDGKVYVSQRVGTANFSGKWQFPGGKLEDGENPIDGAVREVKEETGLVIDKERLNYVGSITGDPTTKVCYVYYVDLGVNEEPRNTEKLNTNWQLITLEEAKRLDLMPGILNVIDKLQQLTK